MDHDMGMMAPSGNFRGHMLPGVLFLLWAAWWMVGLWRRREVSRPAGAPLESDGLMPWIKIVLPLAGMVAEMPGRGWDAHAITMNHQHMTMYAFFAVCGVVDLLQRRGRVSAGATYLAFTVACANAGLLFLGHGVGSGVEGRAHGLLALLFFCTGALAVAEWLGPGRDVHWLRVGALAALGGWFCQIAWILFRSGYDLGDPVSLMRTHLLFSLQILLWIAVLVGVRSRNAGTAPAQRSVP